MTTPEVTIRWVPTPDAARRWDAAVEIVLRAAEARSIPPRCTGDGIGPGAAADDPRAQNPSAIDDIHPDHRRA